MVFGILGICADITERKKVEIEKENLIRELKEVISKVKTLGGLLPICAHCKRIRNEQGYWNWIEEYFRDHSGTDFSHGTCPECAERHYPDGSKNDTR